MLENIESVLSLGEEHPLGVTSNGKAEEVMELAQVSHGKLSAESGDDTLKKGRCRGREDDVVDVEEQVCCAEGAVKGEERHIRLGACEAKVGDEGGEAMVPRARGLLQAVESTIEAAHMIRVGGINEPSGLVAEHHLGELAMEEGIRDVELPDLPVGGEGDGEDDPDGSRFNNRAKCLVEVDVVLLRETAQYPACFVAVESAVSFEVMTKDPFARDDVGVGG